MIVGYIFTKLFKAELYDSLCLVDGTKAFFLVGNNVGADLWHWNC
jgi:hypothetical protein